MGMCGCARVCTGVRGYAWVWDVSSEFLLENRVPTSADFNTFPIRIFLLDPTNSLDFGLASSLINGIPFFFIGAAVDRP